MLTDIRMSGTIVDQRFNLAAVGAVGAGIENRHVLQEILANPGCYTPATTRPVTANLLTAAEQRRISHLTRLVLAAAEQACPNPPEDIRAVFVSNGGDGVTTHAICETLAGSPPEMSPTRFTNSVHNAGAAYWSMATHRQAATTSLSAGKWGMSAGLIEALLLMKQSATPVLLVAYDAPYPFPLSELTPVLQPLAIALYLTPDGPGQSWQLALRDEKAETLPPILASHFGDHSCEPGMIWLSALEPPRRVVLPYLDGLSVVLETMGA